MDSVCIKGEKINLVGSKYKGTNIKDGNLSNPQKIDLTTI